MKLWNELTEEEQKTLIEFCEEIAKIIEVEFVDPLVKLIDDLSFFFIAMEGIIREEQYKGKRDKK